MGLRQGVACHEKAVLRFGAVSSTDRVSKKQ